MGNDYYTTLKVEIIHYRLSSGLAYRPVQIYTSKGKKLDLQLQRVLEREGGKKEKKGVCRGGGYCVEGCVWGADIVVGGFEGLAFWDGLVPHTPNGYLTSLQDEFAYHLLSPSLVNCTRYPGNIPDWLCASTERFVVFSRDRRRDGEDIAKESERGREGEREREREGGCMHV